MEIIIAVLLGLILVALVAGNKEAARAVFGTLRGVFVGVVLLLAWGILIGGTVHHYLSYTEQKWYHTFGMIVAALLPPILLWAYRGWVRETLARGTKTVLMYLAVLLFGVVLCVGGGALFQELKKDEPYLSWIILFSALAVTGVVLIGRGLSDGWRVTFTFPPSPTEAVRLHYEVLLWAEHTRWLEKRDALNNANANYEELENLSDDYEISCEKLIHEQNREITKAIGLKKKENYVLLAFYAVIFFIFIGLIGLALEHSYAYVQRFF
jgi:hypothetical protein